MGSRGGIANPTSPKGWNNRLIAVPKFLTGAGSCSRAARRMSLASCSMERPFSAALIRSRRFNSSSRWRTVMLAMESTPLREYV